MSGVKKVKDIKQKKLQELMSNLAEPTSTVSSESCYFVVLPNEEVMTLMVQLYMAKESIQSLSLKSMSWLQKVLRMYKR